MNGHSSGEPTRMIVLSTRRARTRRWRLTLVAFAAFPTLAAAQSTTRVFEHYTTDALGSIRAVTKRVNGVLQITRHDFMPFGDEVAPPPPPSDKRLFTGKERDNETGMDYFGARHYRANLGRFTTVDPELNVKDALADPQRWNRYAYARNNPLRFTDPDGRDIWDIVNGALNAFASNAGFAPRSSGNSDYRKGQLIGDVGSLVASGAEFVGGGTLSGSGVVACGTGVGCLVGAPAAAEGAAVMTHSVVFGANAGISLMKGLGSNSEGMLGAGGTQTTSKTLYNREGVRLDVENPAPGSRPGQIHVQIGKQKFLYDPSTGQFQNAPSSVQKLLENERIKKAIETGMRYLGAQ
jgi:RHS repeat-associated protein